MITVDINANMIDIMKKIPDISTKYINLKGGDYSGNDCNNICGC